MVWHFFFDEMQFEPTRPNLEGLFQNEELSKESSANQIKIDDQTGRASQVLGGVPGLVSLLR